MFLCEIITRKRFLLESGVHNNDALLIVLAGAFEFSFDGTRCAARVNDIVFFPKDMRFSRRVLAPLTCLYIESNSAFHLLKHGLLHPSDVPRQINTIRHLHKAAVSADAYLITHYVNDLVILAASAARPPDKPVRAVVAYINKNYALPLDLTVLSELAGMSKQGLISAFKRYMRKPPIAYLTHVRLQNSKELLKTTTASVSEIAELCGFSSVYYFSNVFKKHIGISPHSFRKTIRL